MQPRILPFVALFLFGCPPEESEDTSKDPLCQQEGNICTWAGVPETAMFADEDIFRLDAPMYLPQDIFFGADGTPYFPDFNNHRIRRVDEDGRVHTVSGTGMLGDGPIGNDGCFAPDYCDALDSAWNHPTDVALDPNDPNSLYVAAWHNSRINRIDLSTGKLEWFAGTGGRYFGGEGGPKLDAILDLPSSLAFDEGTGRLYFGDQANHVIRRIEADGTLTTVAGLPREPGYSGEEGPAAEAQIHGHTDQKADPGSKMDIADGMLYFTDTVNGVIRRIDLDAGTIHHLAGVYTSAGEMEFIDPVTTKPYTADAGSVSGYSGDGGPATEAVFNTPRDLAVSEDGNLMYVADTKNNCVRVIDLVTNLIETFAGQCGVYGFDGDKGPATEALLSEPFGLEVGHDGYVYIADTLNHVIRRVKVSD
jgi:DNA-binding beta-propeller fold protein YncE